MIDETLLLIIRANALRLADRLERRTANHDDDKTSIELYVMPADARVIAKALRLQYGV